jgi:hypothetical protein
MVVPKNAVVRGEISLGYKSSLRFENKVEEKEVSIITGIELGNYCKVFLPRNAIIKGKVILGYNAQVERQK